MRRHNWIITLAALLALTPTVLHGPSDGKDLMFHVQSWLGAADQFRHGVLWLRWDPIAAYNAGEPRFVFYPPVSWMLGGLLTLILPFAAVQYVIAWVCMTIAGFAMHHLGRRYLPAPAALLAACVYLANPFLLLTILSRSAYGELFVQAFCPWLLAAALEARPRVHRIALPLGLIWLSNIPGAVLCTYLLGFVLAYRLLEPFFSNDGREGHGFSRAEKGRDESRLQALRSAGSVTAHRGYVQTSAAKAARIHSRDGTAEAVPFPSYISSENAFAAHLPSLSLPDGVSSRPEPALVEGEAEIPAPRQPQPPAARPASRLIVTFVLALIFAIALDALSILPAVAQRNFIQVSGAFPIGLRPIDNLYFLRTLPADEFFIQVSHLALFLLVFTLALLLINVRRSNPLQTFLLSLTTTVGLCLTFTAKPLWQYAPALFLVQFPWRALFLVAAAGSIASALALERLRLNRFALILAPVLSLTISGLATQLYQAACGPLDTPAALQTAFVRDRQNVEPTDEYVVANADPDLMNRANPPYWLARNPTDQPFCLVYLTATPLHFEVSAARNGFLVLNLQNYPNWLISANGRTMPHLSRADGLVAIALPPGLTRIDIHWRHTPDEIAGLTISLAAWLFMAAQIFKRPLRRVAHPFHSLIVKRVGYRLR